MRERQWEMERAREQRGSVRWKWINCPEHQLWTVNVCVASRCGFPDRPVRQIHRDLQYENKIFLTCLPSYEQQTSEKIPQQDSNPLRLPDREPKRYHMTLDKTSKKCPPFYLKHHNHSLYHSYFLIISFCELEKTQFIN